MLLPILLISVVVLAAAAAYIVLQNRAFESTIDALRARVAKSADRATATPALPDVVRNYAIRAGGTVGGPAQVYVRQKALLSTDKARAPMKIEADQWLATYQRDLVWRGRGSMFGFARDGG